MPLLVSRATGNFTAAATWGVAEAGAGAQLTAPTASTTTTTSYVYSSTFTGTNTKVADGVALFLSRVNTTGTFTVALSDDNGVTATRAVTVNASDLPVSTAWVFFKFGTTLTLDGGTDYRVGILGSSAGNVTVYRDATAGNWARIISTTDTAAPAAADTMLIVGELTGAGTSNSYTVTMDNTATTDFGNGTATATLPTNTSPQNFNGIQIGNKGTMTWGTSAATAYYLKLSGNLIVYDGGTYNMGTVATPCPRDSSMYLQLDCVAEGDFGVLFFNGSTANIQGQSRTSGKNVWYCKLNANAAANATSLTVDTDTGWLSGDAIAIASTTQTPSQSEAGTLNGNAGASTLSINGFGGTGGGLGFAHDGVSPVQAEIVLLTRNVRISGGSSTAVSYFYIGSTATCNFDWVEFFWVGASAAGKRAIYLETTTGTFDMQYCCIRDTRIGGISQAQNTVTGSIVVSNNASWRTNTAGSFGHAFAKANAADTVIVSNNIFMFSGNTTSHTALSVSAARCDGNIIAASTGIGVSYGSTQAPPSFSNNISHSCGSHGFSASPSNSQSPTFVSTNTTAWRCGGVGYLVASGTYATSNLDGLTLFGNTSANFQINPASCIVSISNATMAGDTTFATTVGILFSTATFCPMTVLNSTLGVASGIMTSHTRDIDIPSSFTSAQVLLTNVTLASATEVNGPGNLTAYGFIKSSKHDQTAGAFRSWFQRGRIDRDTTIFNTAAPSERLTPTSASFKLVSGSRVVAVDNGTTITINAYVRKSVAGDGAAYNGNQPRLIVKANPACGINSDTVLDTMTVGTGSWEQLTGTTAAVNADGALEFVVDCDGTAGWINIDDWTVA